MRTLRVSLLTISAVAAAVFAAGLVLSLMRPVTIEFAVRDLIRREVERRVGQRMESLDGGVLSKLASRVTDANASRIAQIRKELPAVVSTVIAEMQDGDCECRKFVAAAAQDFRVTATAPQSRVAGCPTSCDR